MSSLIIIKININSRNTYNKKRYYCISSNHVLYDAQIYKDTTNINIAENNIDILFI